MTTRPLLAAHGPPQHAGSGFTSRGSSLGTSHPPCLPLPTVETPEVVDLTLDITGAATGETSLSTPATSRSDGAAGIEEHELKPEIGVECTKEIPSDTTNLDLRSRPKVRFDGEDVQHVENSFTGYDSSLDCRSSPPPMPQRPGSYVPRKLQQSRKETNARSSGLGKMSNLNPYVLEAPLLAPRFSRRLTVDFFPWSGNHPEDVLSEQVTKQGFYDKSQVSQNETNTASTALKQAFKHKSGLQNLSSLFVSVYEQRQAHGRVTTASAFKPPPRVTLTDTKREAWLRDLANLEVPLRRLSRTIPHGIRGKILLEQCLVKFIPTARAIWLAKCVGANEMRAFRRKGVSGALALGGEVKWVRDWTIFVEQFLEGVIIACGEKNWKDKVIYALGAPFSLVVSDGFQRLIGFDRARLSSYLYAENLLDKDHYLGWLLASLAGCLVDRLPVWLLVVQVFWNDLLQSRKHGLRLAECLLEKIQLAATGDERELSFPIIQRLKHLVADLMVSSSSNFISPTQWSKNRTTLQSCINQNSAVATAVYASIARRNLRLLDAGTHHKADAAVSARRRFISLLDSNKACFRVEELIETCSNSGQCHLVLVLALLEWMSSPYRDGIFRVFLAVRVLRHLGEIGIDIDGCILEFLTRSRQAIILCKANVYQLVSELVTSGHFSASRYLQWLIARGALNCCQALRPDDPCDIRLLAELPLRELSPHVLNLRRMLLMEAGFAPGHETQLITKAKNAIAQQLPKICLLPGHDSEDRSGHRLSEIDLLSSSRTVMAEACHWIRQQLSNFTLNLHQMNIDSRKQRTSELNITPVSLHEFNVIRCVLESCRELSALADILRTMTKSDDPILLATLADTVNANLESFAAMGIVNEIFHGLVKQERVLGEERSSESLLTSLLELGSRLWGQDDVLERLRLDLGRYGQRQSTTAAWSPISDHLTDVLPITDINEEAERMLASGTSMDKQTLKRLFEALVLKLESVLKRSREEAAAVADILYRLRKFDLTGFDELMAKYTDILVHDSRSQRFFEIIPCLVNSKSLTLVTVFKLSVDGGKFHAKGDVTRARYMTALKFLELITKCAGDETLVLDQGAYRWRLEQQRFCSDNAMALLGNLCMIMERNAQIEDQVTAHRLKSLMSTSSIISMLQALIIQHTATVQSCLTSVLLNTGGKAGSEVIRILNNLLYETHGTAIDSMRMTAENGHFENDPKVEAVRTMRKIDDFTLPFCQIKLQLLCDERDLCKCQGGEGSQSSMITSLCRSIDLIADEGDVSWMDAISLLDNYVVNQIREQAEGRLLSSVPTSKEALYTDQASKRRAAMHSFSVVSATSHGIQQQEAAQLSRDLIEKVECLSQLVSSEVTDRNQPLLDGIELQIDGHQHTEAIHFWVDLLLRLVVVQRETFRQAKIEASDQARLLVALCSILVNEDFRSNSDLSEYALDVTSYLVDDLSEEARTHCTKYVKERSYDFRLRYLFGYREDTCDWIHLSQRGKIFPYPLKHWEILPEPTPIVGENDTSLSLGLFEARKT